MAKGLQEVVWVKAGGDRSGNRRAQLAQAGCPGPKLIGIDEISIRKGHSYRIVVSDLIRGRAIWFGGQQAAQYCLPAEGVLRPALELRAGGLGAAILRELADKPEMAAPESLREVRRNDRSPLGRNRRLLKGREQGIARVRRRIQQQNPRHPTPCIRTARPGIPAIEDPRAGSSILPLATTNPNARRPTPPDRPFR